jgi:lipoprotein-anchoring transpeptidase ErfK/SrfK
LKLLIYTVLLITLTTIGATALRAADTNPGDMEGASTSGARPVDVDVTFNESTFTTQPWTKEFHYVIIVNKANSGLEAQSIKVYEFGKLILTDKVSTGRDEFEAKGEHHSKMAAWTVTPTGYYTPMFLDKDHKSSAYGGKWSWLKGGVKMPFAIFFNGGIALHQAPTGTESMLGKKASGGCIRLPEILASDLFTRVGEGAEALNPRFNVDGTGMYDLSGNIRHSTTPGFSTLVVVQNKIIK